MKKKRMLNLSLYYKLPISVFLKIPAFFLITSNILYYKTLHFDTFKVIYKKKRKKNLLKLINTIRNKQKTEIMRYLYLLIVSNYFFKTSLKFNQGLFLADAETKELAAEDVTPLTAVTDLKVTFVPIHFQQLYFFENNINLYLDIILYTIYSKIQQDIKTFKQLFYFFFKKSQHPRIKLKRQFPSINIAFRFKICKHVIF